MFALPSTTPGGAGDPTSANPLPVRDPTICSDGKRICDKGCKFERRQLLEDELRGMFVRTGKGAGPTPNDPYPLDEDNWFVHKVDREWLCSSCDHPIHQHANIQRSTEERKRGRIPKADAVGLTLTQVTLEMLQENFETPQYVRIKEPPPLGQGEKVFDRAGTVIDFDNYVKELLCSPAEKGPEPTVEQREHYPLLALNAPPGMGKTFILHLLAQHCYARPANLPPMLPVLLSFGTRTLIQEDELKYSATDAIVIRILFTLFPSAQWPAFLCFCHGRGMPTIEGALKMVREATKWEGAFLLLVDESAASTKLVDENRGNSFSSALLVALGLAQQASVQPVAEGGKGVETAIFVVATSLRNDIIEQARSSSGRPITLLGCPPLSAKSLTELLATFTDRLHRKAEGHHDKATCKRYVEAHLIHSGGIPRAVQMMYIKLFGLRCPVTLADHYSFPTWTTVRHCLRGQPVNPTSQEMAVAMSCGVYFSPEGVPMIPPFQLARWAKTVTTADREAAKVAEIIKYQIPLALPSAPPDVHNAAGMRLTFERVTQAFEQVQHELLHDEVIPLAKVFPVGGIVTNAPETAAVRLHQCCRDGVRNYPQDVTSAGHLDQFLKGERLIVPTNPNNVAADYGCVVEYGSSASSQMRFTQQDSQNKFTEVPVSTSTIVKEICKLPLLTEPKLRLIFLYTKNDSNITLPPATEEAVTVVVTHKGSQSLLGGLGGVVLTFAESDPKQKAAKKKATNTKKEATKKTATKIKEKATETKKEATKKKATKIKKKTTRKTAPRKKATDQ